MQRLRGPKCGTPVKNRRLRKRLLALLPLAGVSDVECLAPAASADRTGHRIELKARDVLVPGDVKSTEARGGALRAEILAQLKEVVRRGLLFRGEIRRGLWLKVGSGKYPLCSI